MENRAIPFRPNLEGQFKERFNSKAQLISTEKGVEFIENLVEEEIKWVEQECVVNLNQRRKYRAVWLLLRDLVRASWDANFYEGTLEMRMPTLKYNADIQGDAKELKAHLRSWMQESRVERLLDFSDFIERMENKNQELSRSKKPIEVLFADGNKLADKLELVKKGEIGIEQAVSPYLQLVEEGSVDEHTGLKLGDIWRYCRLTWSTPSESTPGRTLLYLIRDAAHPYHAIMGIASIENCAVQITCRDEYLGWNATNFIEQIRLKENVEDIKDEFMRLLEFIEDGIANIDISEICTSSEIEKPTDELVRRLQDIAIKQEELRQNLLKKRDEKKTDMSSLGSISVDTEKALYMRKRADQLAKLIMAKIQLTSLCQDPEFKDKYSTFLVSDNGYSAIRTALVAQKTKHIGSSMMELNVCGAIPPYNEILGGKLVALLAMSPQVINDYKNRYKDRKSEIATRLKNEDVVRAADLVYMGTTSLYYVGSSQYNRVKIPHDLFEDGYEMEWKRLGMTVGFGTMHISKSASASFNEVISGDKGYNHFNHVFGEGASPKMRLMVQAIRSLLDCTNEDSKDLAKHAMSRIVYGVSLAQNTREYLLGYDDVPKYYFTEDEIVEKTQRIIDYWRNRWVLSRLNHAPVFQKLREFDKEKFLVSNDIKEAGKWIFKPLSEEKYMDTEDKKDNMIEYLRQLYRGISGFADHIPLNILKMVHVETKLDEAILSALKAGKDVILTGNAGDGKTHLIRILEERINSLPAKPQIELDASTKSNEELFVAWKSAKEKNIPFCCAINGAVLYGLEEEYGEEMPSIHTATEQMFKSVYYGAEPEVSSDVIVFDLSRRNVLSESVLRAVIDSITKDEKYVHCNGCAGKGQCDVHRNRMLLKENVFVGRLYAILCRVGLSGYHATLRDLQALVSYLIFGNRKCQELLSSSGENEYFPSELLYSGEGKLFDAIRKSFDPTKVAHPHVDEKLICAEITSESWVQSMQITPETIEPNNLEDFNYLKRKFFFFNEEGNSLLEIYNDDVSVFQEFLKLDSKDAVKDLIKKLNAFFQNGKSDKQFELWEGFRYNSSPRKVLVSRSSVKKGRFEVEKPKLLGVMSEGIDVENHYCKMIFIEDESISLKIDLGMYTLMSQAERGIPVLYMDNNNIKRIWKFIEQLAGKIQLEDEEAEIKVLDVQNRKCVAIDVDIDAARYTNLEVLAANDRR